MTDPTALAEQILKALGKNPLDFGGYIAHERFGKEECVKAMRPAITQALIEARRETWEEAAQMLEDDCYGGPTVDHDCLGHDDLGNEKFKHNTNQVRLAKEFREQVKAQP